jgi:ABC-type sugar transport system substrate-binding protein
MNNWQRFARMSLPALLAVVLVACGESGNSTSSGDGAADAAAAPDPVTTAPTKINVSTPLAAPPAAGKTLFWLQCELPICEKIGGGVKAATEAAGWNYESLVFKSADPGSGIEAAVQQKPDVIAITGIPSAAVESQLKAAAAAGIPVVTCAPGPEEPSAEAYAAICSQTTAPDGKNLALWAIKDSGGEANIVTVTIPAFPALGTTVAGINDTVDEYCPDCSADELELTVDDLAGGQVVPKLVAYLQSNPDTNYVLFNFADLEIGVPEALDAAGLDKVKLIGNGGGPQQFQALVDGDTLDAAWVAYPAVYQGWEMVDAALRLVDGGTVPDGYQQEMQALPTYIVDTPEAAEQLAPAYDWEGPEGYQEQFKELWLVG